MSIFKRAFLISIALFLIPLHVVSQSIEDFWPDAVQQESELLVVDTLTTLETLTFPSEKMIIPGLIRVKRGGGVLYDFYSRQLYTAEIESLPDNATELGRGHGSGPEEYRFISSIDQDNNGNIFALDTELMRLLVWDAELENRIIQLSGGGMPSKLATTDNGFVLKHSSIRGADYLFTVHSNEGDLVNGFHQPKEWDGIKSPLFYSGNIYTSDNKVIYVSSSYGILKVYGIDGSHYYTREMVEPLNALRLHVNRGSNSVSTFRDTSSRFTAIDMAVENGVIYVLYSGTQHLSSNRIDAYKLDDGGYLGSYILDQRIMKFSIDDNRIFSIKQEEDDQDYDPTILVYDLHPLQTY